MVMHSFLSVAFVLVSANPFTVESVSSVSRSVPVYTVETIPTPTVNPVPQPVPQPVTESESRRPVTIAMSDYNRIMGTSYPDLTLELTPTEERAMLQGPFRIDMGPYNRSAGTSYPDVMISVSGLAVPQVSSPVFARHVPYLSPMTSVSACGPNGCPQSVPSMRRGLFGFR